MFKFFKAKGYNVGNSLVAKDIMQLYIHVMPFLMNGWD
jgi:hypothetical protein